MGSKRKDLEIIYNLQWKNKPANGGDKANIIGMYDVPATTLNWEIFKSYLLKNSGTVGEDVKVSYITDSNREFPIESQTDFQIALYAFRRKARMGDIVNLKLDTVSELQNQKGNMRHSNDAETQFDNNETMSMASNCCNSDNPPEWFMLYMNQFKKDVADEVTTTVSNIVSNIKPHTVTQPSCYHSRKSKAESSKRLRKLQPLIAEQPHETKELIKSLKIEGKLERKLEKLDHKTKKCREKKLALYTKSSDSEVGHSSSKSRPNPVEREDDVLQMDALPVNTQSIIPHMLGGEVYLHQWEVLNTGKLPWTSKTSLIFTWGSKALKPLDVIISVPYLRPGETGTVAVRLQIPNQPGEYECYWHFHHKERRFGHWLGCQIIVDPFDLKGNKSVLETTQSPPFKPVKRIVPTKDNVRDVDDEVTHYTEILQAPSTSNTCKYAPLQNKEVPKDATITSIEHPLDNIVRDISARIEDIKLQDPTDTNCSSDSDNHSIISLSESNCSKGMPDEFVVVPIPDCFKLDAAKGSPKNTQPDSAIGTSEFTTDAVKSTVQVEREQSQENYDDNNNTGDADQNRSGKPIEDDASSCSGSNKSDIVIITLPENDDQSAEYAYVVIDGQKLQIPKKMIKSEYLEPAENTTKSLDEHTTKTNSSVSTQASSSASTQILQQVPADSREISGQQEVPTVDPNLDGTDLISHCSAAGSCFSDANGDPNNSQKNPRLFIFPQNYPGYEVVYPVASLESMSEQQQQNIFTWANSRTQYSYPDMIPLVQPEPQVMVTPPINITPHDQIPVGENPYVPNFQQTPPEQRSSPIYFDANGHFEGAPINQSTPVSQPAVSQPSVMPQTTSERGRENVVHILPETLVSGAVNVASSAINTARSVINMIRPQEMPMPNAPTNDVLQQPGRWVNGHWVSTNPDTSREANLQALAEMGFWDRDLNATLLARYNDDLSRVVAELVQ